MNPNPLPTIALSIRQPWAWLIVNGFKDIENRGRCIKDHLGPVLIHASATMTRGDYDACWLFLEASFDTATLAAIADKMPVFPDFPRGGIVGVAYIHAHGNFPMTSPWWTGPYSYSLKNARPLSESLDGRSFIPCKGRLGFFRPDLKSEISNLKS